MTPTTQTTRAYLDYNATAPMHPDVVHGMTSAMSAVGNPSSIHAEGRRARDLVERARRQVAAFLDVDPIEVIFTSGGTEANRLAVALMACQDSAGGAAGVVAAGIEHPCVTGGIAAAGSHVCSLRVDGHTGQVDLVHLREQLEAGARMLAVQWANHETGCIQGVAAIAALASEYGAQFHCDAVQAAGKIAFSLPKIGLSSLAISAHKLGGPMGAGALWVRGAASELADLGGHQERGRRPGTENVLGIVGLGIACTLSDPAAYAGVGSLRDHFENTLSEAGFSGYGRAGERVPNTACIATGVPADVLVTALDLEGFAISAGAACSSGVTTASPVLRAMGVAEAQARESVRVSLGPSTTAAEVDRLGAIFGPTVERIRTNL